jgi:hypothetical protein
MQKIQLRFVPAALLALTGLAYAAPPSVDGSPPVLPPNTPARCSQVMLKEPAMKARIAAGNCLARESLKLVPVTEANLETANALATAVAPAMALFDNVIAQGDPYYSMLAEDAKRDVYEGMAVRLRRAVQPDDEVASIEADMLVANWLDNVALSTVRITELAENDPDAANRDPVISAITQRATTEEATQISTRSPRR